MQTSRPALLFIIVPLWLICFGLSLRDAIRQTPFPPVLLHFARSDYPTVLRPRSTRPTSELRAGDTVLQWGAVSLHGADETDYFGAVAEHSENRRARVSILRSGQPLEMEVHAESYRIFWPRLPAAIVFLVVGAILWYRAPRDALTHAFVTMLFGGAFLFVCTFSGPPWLINLSFLVQAVGVSMLTVFGLRGMLLFPRGVFPKQRLIRALPWLCLPLGVLDVERTRGALLPPDLAHRLSFTIYAVVFAILLVDSAVKYRTVDPLERRKIKWVLWGTFMAVIAPGVSATIALVSPGSSLNFYVYVASLAIIPLCLLIAIVYFNLFDINRVLTVTASLSVLTFLGIAILVWVSPYLSAMLADALRVGPSEARIFVALCLPFFVLALQRRVQPWLDRLMFSERVALERGLEELNADIVDTVSIQELFELVTLRLKRLINPDNLALFVRSGANYACAQAFGAGIPPALPADHGLAASLANRRGAWTFELGRTSGLTHVDVESRAQIQAMDVRVALAFRRDDTLLAILCLGPKGSGDIYVSSDVALLSSLSHHVAQRLSAMEKDARYVQSQRSHAALRRYVPGAVANELLTRGELVPGERDLSLVFVDIRGYSTYAEGRPPSEVFDAISDYTYLVSEVARDHGGSVVEFNGDGMMIVFGAPRHLQHKEQHAVDAALGISAAVAEGRLPGLAVGVGIATGNAFVGSIQTADRFLWTALGETTNRAARLQVLTRELGASVIIDDTTYRGLMREQELFVVERTMRLRGHARLQKLYAVPLAASISERAAPLVG